MQNRIRHWRRERGLTQEALGRMIGLGKPAISKLERGDLHLRDVTIAKLVGALDVPAEELLGDFAPNAGATADTVTETADRPSPSLTRRAKPARRPAPTPHGEGDSRADTADFGFREVGAGDKRRLVDAVFSSVAARYDLMNDLMSAGVHRLWKADMIDWLRPRAGSHTVDVAGGTGDVARRILERAGGAGTGARVTVCDVNQGMVEVGRDRALDDGIVAGIDWLCGDAEALPLADASVDAYTIAFGIRNITRIDRALAEARRVLKPGGRFLCLEFSHVALPALGALYDAYSFRVLPALGEIVTGDRAAYQYLVESIRRFPNQDDFAALIAAAGLGNPRYRNLTGGVAALHSAWRV